MRNTQKILLQRKTYIKSRALNFKVEATDLVYDKNNFDMFEL